MNDDDDDIIRELRNRLSGPKESPGEMHMDQPPSAIMARARGRRLRWSLTGTAAVAVAAGATLALTLGGPAGARPVHVNLDAWSVNTNSNGTVTVSVRELHDPAALRRTLAQAGIPAVVNFGQDCQPAGSSSATPAQTNALNVFPPTTSPGTTIINPRALPKGTEIDLSVPAGHRDGNALPLSARLIGAHSVLVCGGGHFPPGPATSVQAPPWTSGSSGNSGTSGSSGNS